MGVFTFQCFVFFLIFAFSCLSFSSFPLLLDILNLKVPEFDSNSEGGNSESKDSDSGRFQARDSEERDSEDRDSESRDSEARDSENGQVQGPRHSDTP